MLVSAEVRWFWEGHTPERLDSWFRDAGAHPFEAGGGQAPPRTDRYLSTPGQSELGLKIRGGSKPGTEVKGLIAARFAELAVGPFIGPIELWTKWSANSLNLDPGSLLAVAKTRWLRKFDTAGASPREIRLDPGEQPADGGPLPERGCNVELTEVRLPGNGEAWWTLGFESFGGIRDVESSLRAVAIVLAGREAPELTGGRLASYPAWLAGSIRP